MKSKSVYVVIILSIIFLDNYCSQQKELAVPKGAHLGQKPTGMTPKVFAPQILSTGIHELDVTISPDGKEIFFNARDQIGSLQFCSLN